MYIITKNWCPEIFQGRYKKSNYFEGWYIKLIDKSKSNVLTIIPGISKSENDSHAFIQTFNDTTGEAHYNKFSIESFHYSKKEFVISISNNLFSRDKLVLNLPFLKGKLSFINIISNPKTVTKFGIMRPFTFVLFTECYHGIVNLHHEIAGNLISYSSSVSLDGGTGYIEKDWGHSYPKSWLCM